MDGIALHRDLPEGEHRLRDLVTGLESSPPLCALFGGEDGCREALRSVKVALDDGDGYMWVSNEDGTVHVARPYWQRASGLHLYLDLVHELVHVKQHREGRELFDPEFAYVDRPTELEAYRVTVQEARRLGMTDAALFEFLFVEWITVADHRRLCEAVGVPVPEGKIPKRASPNLESL